MDLGSILQLALTAFYYLLWARVIVSWVPALQKNPISHLIHDVTEPILRPVRQLIPPMGGLDLSPLIVTLIIGFIRSSI